MIEFIILAHILNGFLPKFRRGVGVKTNNRVMRQTLYIAITLLAIGITGLSITHPWVAIFVFALLGAVALHILDGHCSILAIRLRHPVEIPPTKPE